MGIVAIGQEIIDLIVDKDGGYANAMSIGPRHVRYYEDQPGNRKVNLFFGTPPLRDSTARYIAVLFGGATGHRYVGQGRQRREPIPVTYTVVVGGKNGGEAYVAVEEVMDRLLRAGFTEVSAAGEDPLLDNSHTAVYITATGGA